MKSIIFTKPKRVTLDCIKFLYEQGEEIMGIVIYNSSQYAGSEFLEFCSDNHIRVFDGDEIYSYQDKLEGQLDMIYSNIYPQLIKRELLAIPQKGAINFHPAPLPEYRGVFGYNFAIFNEENEYGVSVHKLSGEFDRGDIIEVERFKIDSKTINVRDLVRETDIHLLNLFKRTYFRFLNNEDIVYQKQLAGKYYSRNDFEELKKIKDTDDTSVIKRKIRACWYPPYEGAYIYLAGNKYTIVDAEQIEKIV